MLQERQVEERQGRQEHQVSERQERLEVHQVSERQVQQVVSLLQVSLLQAF